ncbi:hypothetical protein [Paractinoplanes brasiliensis]|uniref:Uncharacterized protein n=1 Tax=Paractinoplanes brasiliensis TaxID=52695 RepID=A0A4R6JUS0_9ACTN|nr:hypothetical protein [Actinoplanes brasiliensis]TDO39927.1 hypothetical protein C8E87_3634 [Actinoplanes brasiliensis]GID31548.1 hypothetical protein Abr02nite_65310 [Actinoplanes brasiliensis]
MRKFWYALAGGIFLFAAGPAQADTLPGTGVAPGADVATQQTDEQLADVLGQSNGINIGNPLGHSSLKDTALGKIPIAQFQAGQNSPDLNPALPGRDPGEPRRGLIPRESSSDSPDVIDQPELPAADVVPGSTLPMQGLPLYGTDVSGLPWMTSLLPSGQTRDFTSPPPARQAEMFSGGVPLLGGLGGRLPANSLPSSRDLPAGDDPDISGMPAGGIALLPAALGSPAAAAGPLLGAGGSPAPAGSTPPAGSAPAAGSPGSPGSPASSASSADGPAAGVPAAAGSPGAAQQSRPSVPGKPAKAQRQKKPAPAATPDDPRLHEEPVETDDAPEHRPFSADGRPVAGIDQQYR